MKIIRLTTFLDFGGIERKMEKTSKIEDDNQWIFLAINKGGSAEKAIKRNGKKVFCLNLPYKIFSFKTFLGIYNFIKKENPDVVHTAGAEANFYGILAAKFCGIKLKIAEEIGIPNHSKNAKFIFKRIFGLATKVVGESNKVVEHLHNHYKISNQKLIRVSNFIDTEKILLGKQEKSDNAIFTIISLTRLVEVKNIPMALNVLSQFKKNGGVFVYKIVGEGPLRKELERLSVELNIENEVQFLGYDDNPRKKLENTDLFLMTSDSEGFSNALLEAMSIGIPALSTRVGGAEDAIIDGDNGWLVDVRDDNALLDKLFEIYKTPNLERKKIGKRGQKQIEKNFNFQGYIKSLQQLYDT